MPSLPSCLLDLRPATQSTTICDKGCQNLLCPCRLDKIFLTEKKERKTSKLYLHMVFFLALVRDNALKKQENLIN